MYCSTLKPLLVVYVICTNVCRGADAWFSQNALTPGKNSVPGSGWSLTAPDAQKTSDLHAKYNLSSLPETQFTVLEHPFFPNHRVRVKKTKFCDTTVKCANGIVPFTAKSNFYA